jgi:ArsR family transcriptional regulator, arsenate/arsenite/antimonite-responsive transcriptional repressor
MDIKTTAAIFNALADRTRLRILNLLGEGELCVCDLMKLMREPQSKVSRHLSYLRRSGLVQPRKKGLWVHYGLSKAGAAALKVLSSVCGGRCDCSELKEDLKSFEKKKSGLISCCR